MHVLLLTLARPGGYGSEIYTLRSSYFQGRPPRSVNLHWRRFALAAIPLDDDADFERWLHQRWLEKDQLLEHFVRTGRFPSADGVVVDESDDGCADDGRAAKGSGASSAAGTGQPGVVERSRAVERSGVVETKVRLRQPAEYLLIFMPTVALMLVVGALVLAAGALRRALVDFWTG